MKKTIFVISFIVLSGFLFGFSASDAKAVTLSEIQTQITKLQNQINELQKLLSEFQSARGLGEQIQKSEKAGIFAPGKLLVRFKDNVPEEKQKKLLKDWGFTQEKEIKQIKVKVINVPEQAEEALARALSKNPNIDYAEVDGITEAISVPNDPYFSSQWGMATIQAPEAWDITTASSTINIAILDTGVDQDHPDLADKIVSNINFTSSPTVDDVHGHGTHVAGIAGAVTNNGIGVAGLGYTATIMNVKVVGDTGTGTYGGLASGIVWAADNGAEIVNMSVGAYVYSSTLEDAVNYAWSKGVVMVGAAGNGGKTTPFYPAAYANCIAVAATYPWDAKADWSNYGDWVDVAAPGGGIYATVKDNGYDYKSGTSMAAPHVAGLATLVFTQVSDTNGNGFLNDEVRNTIESSCDDIGVTGIGSGRINAFSAVSSGDGSHTLTGTIQGTGSGTINVNPPGINYTSNFTRDYEYGTSVTLTATPATSSVFLGWSGACTGTGTCTISMTSGKSVTATFDTEVTYTLSVDSSPVTGITIDSATGHSGTTNYTKTDIESGTAVSLTAPATYSSYIFSNWTGCDSVTSTTCNLTINNNRTVTASYELTTHTLSVSKAGTGSGTITSNPAGISCGATCSASYNHDTSVTLTATPAAGSTFAGWSGACIGTGTCTISMTSDKSVTATFDASEPPPECTTYNGYIYCRGFKSTDSQDSSCNAACSTRGYTCPVSDNMFRSESQIIEVATKLGLLVHGESYSSREHKNYSSPFIMERLSTGAKYLFYNQTWNQSCVYTPRTHKFYESINICRCEERLANQNLEQIENQLASISNVLFQLIEQVRDLIGK